MRISCPICGARDVREFYYQGAALAMARPAPDAGAAAWDDYVYLRDNPAGMVHELWSHDGGCSAWLTVMRDVRDHTILDVKLCAQAAPCE